MDKSVILSDAVRMVVQLRDEAQKLKESYDNLQEKVNELKVWSLNSLFCWYFLTHELCIKWLFFCSVVGWEKWTPRWETEAESRERQTWAATEDHKRSTWVFTTPSCNGFSFFSSTSSLFKQNDAISWLPWNPYVAVCASCCSWYLRGSCSPSPSCLNLMRLFVTRIMGMFWLVCQQLCWRLLTFCSPNIIRLVHHTIMR